MYTVKPAWASYLAFIEEAQADAAFQVELGYSACNSAAINTGRRCRQAVPAGGAGRQRRAGSGVVRLLPLLLVCKRCALRGRHAHHGHVHHAP